MQFVSADEAYAIQCKLERMTAERDDAETTASELVDQLAVAETERDALAAHVERLHDFLRTAPIGNGVCCCGDDIATHTSPVQCGHSPVDEVEYAAWNLLDEAPATSLARRDAAMKAEGEAEGAVEWSAVAVFRVLDEIQAQIGAAVPPMVVNDALAKIGLRDHFGDEAVDQAKVAIKKRRQAEEGT